MQETRKASWSRGKNIKFGVNCRLSQISTPPPALLLAQLVKNPPAKWETWVRSLGWEDPLEEGMATHSSILDWKIPIEELGGL